MNPLTKFLALSTATIIIMSLMLTGMFYYVHASEFPSTTITNSTTSTQTIPPFVKSIANMTTIQTATSESRTTSDYGQLGIILTIVLVAVLVAIAVLRRRKK